MQLLTPVRGAGNNDYQPIVLNAVNYADNAEYKQYYSSYTKFQAPGTTPGLALGTKIYSKLGKVNFSPSYNPANSSNQADDTQSIGLAAATNSLNAVTNLALTKAQLLSYSQEAPVVGTTTTIKFYVGAGTSNYYQVVMPTLTANKKTKYNFQLKAGVYGVANTTNANFDLGVATVTVVGSIPAGVVTRIDTTASAALTPIQLVAYNNFLQQVGQVISLDLCCFKEFTMDVSDEKEDVYCRGSKTGTKFKTRDVSGTVVVEKTSPILYAFGLGNSIKSEVIQVPLSLEGYGENDATTIVNSSNRLISGIPTGLQIASVSVGDCNSKSPSSVNLGLNLDANSYYYDSAAGTIEFGSECNEGKLFIKTYVDKIANKLSLRFKYSQIEVALQVLRVNSQTGNNTLVDLKKVQLFAPKTSIEDDGDTVEFEWTASITSDDDGYYAFF
jgi:hypothetical protein